jgi:hypothetical protein
VSEGLVVAEVRARDVLRTESDRHGTMAAIWGIGSLVILGYGMAITFGWVSSSASSLMTVLVVFIAAVVGARVRSAKARAAETAMVALNSGGTPRLIGETLCVSSASVAEIEIVVALPKRTAATLTAEIVPSARLLKK